MKGRNTDEIKDESWLQDLAFAVDITAQLNDLNLKLQGKNKLITNLYDDIKCFITKLRLWKSQVLNENLVHFPTCKELKTVLILSLYQALLSIKVAWNCCQRSFKKDFMIFHLLKIRFHYSPQRLLLMLLRQR